MGQPSCMAQVITTGRGTVIIIFHVPGHGGLVWVIIHGQDRAWAMDSALAGSILDSAVCHTATTVAVITAVVMAGGDLLCTIRLIALYPIEVTAIMVITTTEAEATLSDPDKYKKILTTIIKADKPFYDPEKTKLRDLNKKTSQEN